VLRRPVRHDETLETELVLEDVVLEVGVLASVAVVDLVVGAHDRAGACADSLSEGPNVELVLAIVSTALQVGNRLTYQSNIVKVR
jgi:hypothetical protein